MFSNKIFTFARNALVRSGQIRNAVTQGEPARMEKTINTVTLLGRVGADPQRRGTDQHPVVIFSIATHSNYRYETGEFMQKTDWHRVSVFRPNLRDAVLSFMKKGQRVYVTGKISYGEVKAEDGVPKTVASVVADNVIFFHTPQEKL